MIRISREKLFFERSLARSRRTITSTDRMNNLRKPACPRGITSDTLGIALIDS